MSVAQRMMNIIVFRVHLSVMLLNNVHNTTSNKGGCCMCIGKNKIIDIMIVFFCFFTKHNNSVRKRNFPSRSTVQLLTMPNMKYK